MNSTYTFEQAFEKFILHQKVIGYGFQQEIKVKLPNGYHAYPGGYYIRYENNYSVMISGAALGRTPIQEAMILDPEGIPIVRDTEELKAFEE
jgi:hypothetical protein